MLMLLLLVVGAALALVAAGQSWAHGSVDLEGTPISIQVSGSDVSGVPSALALVGLAAAVAVFATRRAGRYAMGVLVVLAGAGTAFSAVSGSGGGAALDDKAGNAMGITTATASHVGHTAWPWVSALGGILLLLAGVVILLAGRRWPGMSARYDAPGKDVRPGGKGGQAGAAGTGDTGGKGAPGTPADIWKALDRGEDPSL
nr:TIGR02234 family membrane protein [Phaeacidiphilus oryzae]